MYQAQIQWDELENELLELSNRTWDSVDLFFRWMLDKNTLETTISEAASWYQINYHRYTNNTQYLQDFQMFVTNIQPRLEPLFFTINQTLCQSEFTKKLDANIYSIYLKKMRLQLGLFREENLPLQSQIALLNQQYAETCSNLQITYKEQNYNLSSASKFLESNNRDERKEVYEKIQQARCAVVGVIDDLLTQIIQLRNTIAKQAGCENYRDYRFQELGRLDYNASDCEKFHQAIIKYCLPKIDKIYTRKKKYLQLTTLKPYDLEVDIFADQPLTPVNNLSELIQKTRAILSQIDPTFQQYFESMHQAQHLDLESRLHKAPGGFNMALMKTGSSFIFMNSSKSLTDIITLIHEVGHAIHNFRSFDLPMMGLREAPLEMAELASMGLELISLQHWNLLCQSESEFVRMKIYHLERILQLFPSVVLIDSFQHWLYENPNHSTFQREKKWNELVEILTSKFVDRSEYEHFFSHSWQKVLHIFEVPFYYIEYGIAQLGAIALWRNYLNDPVKTIHDYKQALQYGGSLSLKELYGKAGIKFDFSEDYIKELLAFVEQQLEILYKQLNYEYTR